MARVLIVDDSAVDRRLAGGLLDKQPHLEIAYAEHGKQALEQFAKQPPDIVVTDLQMPQMNGLELVGAIRARYPLVPVILMTAQGSEDIAVQALESGAASYVPKSNLARDLLDTVENVLATVRADRRHEKLLECQTQIDTKFVLENDPSLIPPLVDLVQRYISRMKLCDDTGRIRVGIALEEALLNALYHGNLDLKTEELREASSGLVQQGTANLIDQRRAQKPFSARRLHIHIVMSPQRGTFVIRDEGQGFDTHRTPDPADPASLERERGRGLVLMRTFMDEVKYNAQGNEVTLVKHRDD